jgi:Domain of unknown function (DUF4476)
MRTLLLLCSVFISGLASAFPVRYAELSIDLNGRGKSTVIVNGQRASSSNGYVEFYDLRPGMVDVQIMRKGMLVYSGRIDLRAGFRTEAEYRSFGGGLRIVSREPIQDDDQWYDDDDDNNCNNDRDRGRGRGRWGRDRDNDRDRDWDNYYRRDMNAQDFARFKESVQRESFDNEKVDMIKTVLKDRLITSAQAAEVINLITFDNSKLDAAKYVYRYASDKHNYYLEVSRILTFASYKKELRDYIATQQ